MPGHDTPLLRFERRHPIVQMVLIGQEQLPAIADRAESFLGWYLESEWYKHSFAGLGEWQVDHGEHTSLPYGIVILG